jgi:CHAD domain-containing protein
MNQKEISNIIHHFFLRLKKHNRSIKKKRTAEAIKVFRIEVKKLRAFLRLLSLELPDSTQLKLPKELKKMHKRGGVLRDLQLHQKRIRKAIENSKNKQLNTRDLLKPEIKETKKTKQKLLSIKEFIDSEKALKNKLPDHFSPATIRRFFREKQDVIIAIIRKGRYSDKELHNIRKKIKDILYILKLYREDIKKPLGFRFWTSKELQQVKDLEELLGQYNDVYNAMRFLSMDHINKHDGEEKKLLLAVRREVVAEKRKLKKEILDVVVRLNLDKP